MLNVIFTDHALLQFTLNLDGAEFTLGIQVKDICASAVLWRNTIKNNQVIIGVSVKLAGTDFFQVQRQVSGEGALQKQVAICDQQSPLCFSRWQISKRFVVQRKRIVNV